MEDTILAKVQKLVDKAWSTTFEAEKEALLAKADALMVKYSVDQFKLLDPSRPNTAGAITGQEPILKQIWYFGEGNPPMADDEIMGAIHQLFWSLAEHTGCKIGFYGWQSSKVVGYPSDIEFLEMMFLSLKLHLISSVDPVAVPELTWQANAVAMKQAGMTWEQIHSRLEKHPDYPMTGRTYTKSVGLRIYDVHKRWRDANPEEFANTGNPAQWKRSFIRGYVDEVRVRLRAMRQATVEADRNLPALINDRDAKVKEAFIIFFPPPEFVPDTKQSKQRVQRYRMPKQPTLNSAAIHAGRKVAATADLSARSNKVHGSNRGAIGE